MLLRTISVAGLMAMVLSSVATAQTSIPAIAAASRAMGVDTLTSITYSGTARNGASYMPAPLAHPAIAMYTHRSTRPPPREAQSEYRSIRSMR